MTEIPKQLQNPEFRFVLLKPKTKIPFEKNWQKEGYRFDDPKLLKHLEDGGNFGIIGGYGNLRVLDDDKTIKEYDDIQTFTIRSGGGGRHFYFISDYATNHVLTDGKGELRANNYQVVCPSCIHPNGNTYEILKDLPILHIKGEDLRKIIEPFIRTDAPGTPIDENKQTDTSRSGIEFGEVCRLIRKGVSKEEIFERMMAFTKWSNAPEQYRELTYNKALKQNNERIKTKQEIFDGSKIKYYFEDALNLTGFISKRLGDSILSRVRIKTLRGNDRMYYYKDGLYVEGGRELIKTMCANFLQSKFKTNYANEVISYIQATTYIEPTNISNDWINLENGLLNPITREFKEHTPDVFSIVRIPIEYDPRADCPLWKQKLHEKVDDVIADTTQEMFGYGFTHGQKYEVAFMLYGGKRTMKSTVLFVLSNLLGDSNIIAFPLQQLTNDPFSSGYLYGTLANICADLSPQALRDTGKFMMIVGGDKITAGKKHEHPISFYPDTKLIFSCNVIPATTNKNLAFYRRWILLHYNRQTPEDEIDSDMREKLLKELPGILNWSLDGLERLTTNKKFTLTLTPEEIRDLYERNSDTIQSFIFNEINMEDDEGVLTKREVFKQYLLYCKNNELQPENVIKFGRDFIGLTGCGVCKKDVIPAYRGVNFKGEAIDKQKTI